MKKLLFTTLIFLSLAFAGFSQTIPPPYINYQAVLYDVNSANPNTPLTNQSFTTFVNINDELGDLLYREEHYASTDANGLITVKIGDGAYVDGSSPNLNDINWGVGKYFLVVDFVINGDTSSTASEQLVTVPYSFYAGKAGNGISAIADNGDGTLTFVYLDGTTYITPILSGIQGPAGPIGLTGPTGPTGPAGTAGTNGLNALIKTTTEPSGANCTNGGTKIETGLDANNNGILDLGEVNGTQTTYVCNGAGAGGGSVQLSNMQVYSTPGTYSWTCPVGVTKILIELWGAGGGGYALGGGGGGYGKSIINVSPLTNYSIIVGSGGANNGGNSSFGTWQAFGGNYMGAGGSSNCILTIPGEAGKNNSGSTRILSGGQAGNGGNGGSSFENGVFPGGGGGATSNAGTLGAGGLVIIWY
jgi:hypothetical protein